MATSHAAHVDPANVARSADAPEAPWSAAATLARREWVRFLRQPNRVLGAIGQPLMFWVFFSLGLGPSFHAPGVTGELTYSEFFFPGTVVLIVLFTAIFTSFSLIEDRREGFMQSVLVAPIPRWSIVWGKVAGGALIALFEGMLFLLLGLFIGFHPGLFGLLAITLFLAMISVALTALGFAFAWRSESTQGFHAVMSVLLFPMWLLSGAFFPAEQGWLAWVVRLNPLTYGVAGLRRLLYLGVENPPLAPETPSTAACWLATLLFAAGMLAAASRTARRPTKGDLL